MSLETDSDHNVTNNISFTCLNPASVSFINVTSRMHWMIQRELHSGAPAVAVVVSVFFAISFCWNFFILAVFILKHHLLKEPANIFLFNLALVDFLVTVTNLLFSIVSESAKEFVFGVTDSMRCIACQAFGFLLIFLIAVSLHTLAALSVDRFILLAWPLKYKMLIKRHTAFLVLVGIWIVAFLIALPPVLGFGQHEFNTKFGACLPRFEDDPLFSPNNFNYVLLIVVEGFLPLLVLAFTNIWTYKIVNRFLRKGFHRRKTFRESSNVAVQAESTNYHRQQQQLFKVFAALFIAHLICWTPVIVVVFIVIWVKPSQIPPEIYIFGWICYLTNPVCHPIIETFFVKDLRYQVRRVQNTMQDSLIRASSTLYRKASSHFFSTGTHEASRRKMHSSESQGKLELKLAMPLEPLNNPNHSNSILPSPSSLEKETTK